MLSQKGCSEQIKCGTVMFRSEVQHDTRSQEELDPDTRTQVVD
jgi:hypothetical protein